MNSTEKNKEKPYLPDRKNISELIEFFETIKGYELPTSLTKDDYNRIIESFDDAQVMDLEVPVYTKVIEVENYSYGLIFLEYKHSKRVIDSWAIKFCWREEALKNPRILKYLWDKGFYRKIKEN